jgi:hypothetical protein
MDIQIFINIVVGASGVWLIVQSFIMNTHNVKSRLYFNTVPFVLGLCLLFSFAKMTNLL